jgi:hypothetical protein
MPRRDAQAPDAELVRWRSGRLRAGGTPAALADELARDPRYDVHALLALIDRGCPAGLAARILAPLDDEEAPC